MNPPPALQTAIQQKLSAHFPASQKINFLSVGGGSINDTYRLSFGDQTVFCKINSATKFPQLFEKEKTGLALLGEQGIMKVPSVVDFFEFEDKQVLLMEWVPEGERTENFWKLFGEQLAALHQQSASYFGLKEANYMGSVPQMNHQHQSWVSFFREVRLQPMVHLCANKGLLSTSHPQAFEKLYKQLANVFEEEKPSLLHGDLWSGNFMCDQNSKPVLIDPAVYYGHRSIDLAMTRLFGGFRKPFYDAYHYHFPLPSNYEEQWQVCNLYPLLIHLYLFGSSYLSQIERTLKAFA